MILSDALITPVSQL